MKLLIAEDDAVFLRLSEQVLAPEHELVVTHDGNEAWAALQHPDAPRLAILDWVMPGLSGPEVCRRVRASLALSNRYLILFTARNSTADIVSGLRAGADDYITKPVVAEELRARVALGRRILALRDEAEAQMAVAHQAAQKAKRLAEEMNTCPLCRKGRPENLNRGDMFFHQHAERAEPELNLIRGSGGGLYRLPIFTMENSHS